MLHPILHEALPVFHYTKVDDQFLLRKMEFVMHRGNSSL